jgi:hypothetical protein
MKTLFALLLLLTLTGCVQPRPADQFPANAEQTDTTSNLATAQTGGRLLSAFFGLDNGLPFQANLGICRGAGNADGMPVIFAHEVDVNTLQAGDFRVVTQSGKVGEIYCVTLFPAIDIGELRTVLLVGEFGSATDDPPATVEVIGNLLSLDQTSNFKTAQIAVTPLLPGPTLILAEIVPQAQWQLGKAAGSRRGSGSGCPQGTVQIVRAVWAGGVTTASGEEPGDRERTGYQVTVQQADSATRTVTPFALGDLADGDNNHELCLDTPDKALAVAFPAGYLADPNDDLNPATSIQVQP